MQFKPFFTGILALFAAFSLSAEILTPEQALERARTSQTIDSQLQKHMARGTVRLIQTIENKELERPLCYIFSHNLSAEGFTIVAADDRIDPVIGYGDSAFDPANIPPGLEYMLDFYSQELAYLDSPKAPRKANSTNEQVRPNYPHIPTLMTSTWDQSAPYWNKCPAYNGEQCVTGCVATAMAQVMYYHKHPAKGTGSHSYTWTKPNNSTQTLSSNFANTTFDWDHMIDDYSGSYTTTQGNAVATLMSACGISVDMGYNISSNGGSGAFTVDVPTALRTYFGYSPNCRFVNRGSMSLLDFEETVYNALKEDGPVIFCGSSSAGGHCFVCDGYSYNGFFHINWGWAGTSDGYFRLSVLDPAIQGIGGSTAGFNENQGIVIGVHPKRDGETFTPYYSMTFEKDFALKSTSGTTSVNLGSQAKFDATYYSTSSATISKLYIGIKFVNQATQAVSYAAYSSYVSQNLKPNYGQANKSYTVTIPSSLAAGYYTVTPVFFVDSKSLSTMHDFDIAPEYVQSVTMHVENNKAYFMPDVVIPTVTNVTFNSEIYESTLFSVTLDFENTYNRDYVGVIYPMLFTESGSLDGYYTGFPINLLAGEKLTYDYSARWTDLTAGSSYQLAFAIIFNNQTSYQLITPMYPFTVLTAPAEEFEYQIANPTFEGLEGVGMRQITGSFDVMCTSGVGAPNVQLSIYDGTTGNYIGSNIARYAISKDKLRSVSMPVDLADTNELEPGRRYYYGIYSTTDNGATWTTHYEQPFIIDKVVGVITLQEDDVEEICREYYDTMGRRIDSDNIAPGIYIERVVRSDGTCTQRKILR